MRILHTADLHLGKSIYGKSLLEDQKYFLENCFFTAIEQLKPDIVIVAGDIFDRTIAPTDAIRLFDSVILKLSSLKIPMLAITGNHDGEDRITLGASLLRSNGIYIATNPLDITKPVTFTENGKNYSFYLLPHTEPIKMRGTTGFEDVKTYSDTYERLIATVKDNLDKSACNILISHCFVTGCSVSDSESPIFIGGSSEISASIFSDFDYVALGHLHSPQKAGENGRYSGSPLKYSFDEENQNKSITVIDLNGKNITTTPYTYTPLRDMKTIKGNFEELLNMGKESPSDDYIFAHLTDDVPIYMPVDRLREYYPNILGLKSEYLLKKSVEKQQNTITRKSSDQEILSAFLSQICDTEMTEQDLAIFNDAREDKL